MYSQPLQDSATSYRPNEAIPVIRWTAVLSGVFVTLGTMFLLYSLGLSMGFASIDAGTEGRFQAVGVFTGIWGAVTTLVSLFVGGWVASSSAGIKARSSSLLHGFVLWGVTAVALVWLIVSVVSGMVTSAVSVTKSAAELGGSVLSHSLQGVTDSIGSVSNIGDSLSDLGFDADAALRPINNRLQEAGQPGVSADELKSVVQQTIASTIKEGKFDRAAFTNAVVSNTHLSEQDAQSIARDIGQRVELKMQQVRAAAAQKIESGVNKAADVTGTAFLGMFIALALGLAASLGGAITSTLRRNAALSPRHPATA